MAPFVRGISMVALAALVLAFACPENAAAQAATIRFLVPTSPGSDADSSSRVIAERFQAQTGLAVVIENRVGAGGSIAAAALASSPLNGEVVGMQGKSYLLFKEEFPALKIDPSRDLAPVALLGRSATVLAIPAQSRFAGLKELTEFGRANPGQLTYASAGQGSTTFWAAQRMLAASKVTAVHIPFKGSPEIVSELLSGRVDFGYLPSLVASSQIVSGKLKAIAVSAARRLALFPQVPTTLELGLEDSEYESWLMALVPAKTPIAVQERLNRQFTDVVKSAETVAQLGRLGHETEAMNLAQLREFVAKEQVKSTEMARAIRGQRN